MDKNFNISREAVFGMNEFGTRKKKVGLEMTCSKSDFLQSLLDKLLGVDVSTSSQTQMLYLISRD